MGIEGSFESGGLDNPGEIEEASDIAPTFDLPEEGEEELDDIAPTFDLPEEAPEIPVLPDLFGSEGSATTGKTPLDMPGDVNEEEPTPDLNAGVPEEPEQVETITELTAEDPKLQQELADSANQAVEDLDRADSLAAKIEAELVAAKLPTKPISVDLAELGDLRADLSELMEPKEAVISLAATVMGVKIPVRTEKELTQLALAQEIVYQNTASGNLELVAGLYKTIRELQTRRYDDDQEWLKHQREFERSNNLDERDKALQTPRGQLAVMSLFLYDLQKKMRTPNYKA